MIMFFLTKLEIYVILYLYYHLRLLIEYWYSWATWLMYVWQALLIKEFWWWAFWLFVLWSLSLSSSCFSSLLIISFGVILVIVTYLHDINGHWHFYSIFYIFFRIAKKINSWIFCSFFSNSTLYVRLLRKLIFLKNEMRNTNLICLELQMAIVISFMRYKTKWNIFY